MDGPDRHLPREPREGVCRRSRFRRAFGDAGMRDEFTTAQMDSPGFRVIEPKLMPPRVHPGMLRRARLLEMLDDDAGAPFTVVNAAVGYGKTTLVRSWCTERPEAVIWVTLDSADDDPVRLWTHLATAVERLGEGFGRRALSCLRSGARRSRPRSRSS